VAISRQIDQEIKKVLRDAPGAELVFWGDLNRRLKAFDADTGKVLWETLVGGIVSVSTITYAVNGKQCIALHFLYA
jgi:alcohol dehydrogenase (cytochrome c)